MNPTTPVPRRHETPNAVMQTYASRRLTDTDIAVWSVEMAAGAAGPLHSIDVEQVVVILDGELEAVIEGHPVTVGHGGAIVLPAGAERRLLNRAEAPVIALVASRSGARASTGGHGDAGVALPWAE